MSETVTLKSGVECPTAVVVLVMDVLDEWVESGFQGTMLIYDAAKVASDRDYKPSANNTKELELRLGFGDDGRFHDHVADVINNAVTATGGAGALNVVSPVQP